MKTRLVRIGNSRGVRIPKPLITEAGLIEEVELRVKDGVIMIEPASTPRAGWSEAAEQVHKHDEDLLLDPFVPTDFDEKEWEW